MHRSLLLVAALLYTFSATLPAADSVSIFSTNEVWRWFKGRTEASLPDVTAWRSAGFDDTAFTNGAAPFSYGEGYTYGTVIPDMVNQYRCIFLRKTFVLTNAASIAAFRLGAKVDDGFVAWINGVEIERVNMPEPPGSPITITNLSSGAPMEPVPFEFQTRAAPPNLINGTNVIAIQVFNVNLPSTDLQFDCSLDAILVDAAPPAIVSITPGPGQVTSLTEVTVQFSEPVTGVNAQDLSVNGASATGVTGGDDTYTFTFPQPQYGNVFFTWIADHGISDLAFPPNPFNATLPGATWQYEFIDTMPPTVAELRPLASTTVRLLGEVRVTFSEGVVGVTAGDLRLNGIPATNVLVQPGSVFVFQFAPVFSGSAQLSWAPGHGIADVAPAPNAFAGTSWSYVVDPNFSFGDVVINEILAANNTGLGEPGTTGDSDPLPWIELHNRGTNTIDLGGWSLTDDDNVVQRWFFPPTIIGPGDYLVVFASGLDIRNPAGTNRLHTNFRLSRAGEFLGLYSPDSPPALISGFTFPEQRNDISFGRDTSGNLRYFGTATPGEPNGDSSIAGVVEPVHFSVSRGHFTQPFDLVLTAPTRGAEIYYTLNGTEPLPGSAFRYFSPLRVTNMTLVRAAAFRTDYLPSVVETHSYLFNLSAAQRSLPILSIVTAVSNLTGRSGIIGMGGGSRAGDNLYITNNPATDFHNPSMHGIAWERPVSLELINPADNSGFQIDCGLRVQGSDYQRPRLLPTSKFSFRTYFRGDYGEGRLNYPFFPLASSTSFDQLVLRAGFNDQGPPEPFIRDETIRRLSHDMGQIASHGTVMLLFTNGGYAGYYNPTERVHEEFMQSYLGGGSEWDVMSPSFATSSEGPGVVDGDRTEFNSFINYVWNVQNSSTIQDPAIYTEVGRRLDLVNFADYCLLNAYVAMGDWPANNWRAGRERSPNGLWRFIVWDAEWGMGIFSLPVTRDSFAFSGTGTEDAGLNSTGNSEIARLYQRLRSNAEFRLLWADRIQKHFFNGGALTGGNISNRFNQLRAQLSAVIPNMQTEILDWARDRHNIIMGQFNTYGLYGFSNALYGIFASSNAPAFNQHGGAVSPGFALTMSAPLAGSVIYYTTNGDDPRVPFTGAVSNSATPYTGPIVLNQSTVVRARALWNGTNWSALNEAEFSAGSIGVPLRLTEIMYNPTNPAHEFIEIQNVGPSTIDLSGMAFDGIEFTFLENSSLAAGARMVLASDFSPALFAARYPGVPVFGYFDGSLNNAGERITLFDRAGNIIFTVDYDDADGWPAAADGSGVSLELMDVNGDPDDPANWRASTEIGGSPGTANPPPAASNIRLNEVLAENLGAVNHSGTFPDYVELANTGASPIDLAGWSLTDDGNARKFVFPPGATITAGGHIVVWCDATTNTTPGLHAGFALGRSGESVFLYDAGTNLVDAISFGPQVANYTLARVAGSWVIGNPTPNAPNTAATIGNASALSINEFLANPVPGESDWIELFNNSSAPIPLQGLFLGTTGFVHRIVSHSFVPAFGFVQLFADEDPGPDHLDFRLPASGGTILLYDASATEIQRISYGAQGEGVSRGRLPDGSVDVVNFPGTASPGAANFIATYSGPVLNEILARNVSAVTNGGRVPDYVELFNPGASAFLLAGMSLSVNVADAGAWRFPPGASIEAGGYVVVWCDGGMPASTNAGSYNIGESLDGESGGVYLFSPAGQLVNSIEYGFQVANLPIGIAGNAVRLLSTPTPGAANSLPAALGEPAALRINEWMAEPADGPDWFEVVNTATLPVELSHLVLTDDPTTSGTNDYRVDPLSFIGPGSFVQWFADEQPDLGRNHVTFMLDGFGESIRLYASNAVTVIDSVAFGLQAPNVSQGRLPDGAGDVTIFPGSATPEEPNFRLIPNVVIQELLSYSTTAPDAIELRNTSGSPVPIGGWYLSDDAAVPAKYRIPDGTVLAPNAFFVVNSGQFNTGPNAFELDRARGGEVWLSSVDAAGNLTGERARARFGATTDGVSFGRYEGVNEIDYVAQTAATLGFANSAPQLGPVVFSEIMYHPPDGAPGSSEFIELRNISGGAPGVAVDLFYPGVPGRTWQIRGGVEFTFPAGTTLAAGAHVLVVDFNPATDPTALLAFRNHYGIAPSVPVFGPYSGRLDNAGETIELLKPAEPDGAFVPYVLVDKVNYRVTSPWPTAGVGGGGDSLQRELPGSYGNNPASWIAAPPTAGAATAASPVSAPTIVQSPAHTNALIDSDLLLQANATGAGPLSWQWRFNGVDIPGATNSGLYLDFLRPSDSGFYDAYVSNARGPAFSSAARVTVVEPAWIVSAPGPMHFIRGGSNVVFNAVVHGTPPIHYQWSFEGVEIPGANSPSLALSNLALANIGSYSLKATNLYGTSVSNLTLIVLVPPTITTQPRAVTVVQHQTARFTVVAGPEHPLLPLNFRWLRNGVTWQADAAPTLVITNCQSNGTYRVAVTNLAGFVNSSAAALTVLPDADADGLPNVWETAYFGSTTGGSATDDPDHDGMSNVDEFIAGTNPTNALSLLRLEIADDDTRALEFVAQSNISYAVQYRTNFEAAVWNEATNVAPANQLRTIRLNAAPSPAEPRRFYRIMTPAEP